MSDPRPFSDFSFQQYLSEGKLMGCRCRDCGACYLPPKPSCASCYSKNLEWTEIPDTGRLAAFTCITIVPPAMVKEGYNRKNPYCSGVVELTGGLRIDSRIRGVDPKKPEEIHVGMSVRADFIKREKNGVQSTVVAFCPS